MGLASGPPPRREAPTIVYLVTRRYDFTMHQYLHNWRDSLNANIQIKHYESLSRSNNMPPGTYIFSDVERLSYVGRTLAHALWNQLATTSDTITLLNHPKHSLRRHQLLRMLEKCGQNAFRARWLTENLDELRYPVFIREEREHSGNLTPLISSRRELNAAISALRRLNYKPRELLVVEFCDTADEVGVYRKYSAFVVGGEVIPRHLLFGHSWMLKHPELSDEDKSREQREYVFSNPHGEELGRIAAAAGIDYGRIDYAMLNGRIQVWEINTNPVVVRSEADYKPINWAVHQQFATRIAGAFERIAGHGGGRQKTVTLPVGFVLANRIDEWLKRKRHPDGKKKRGKLKKLPKVGGKGAR